MRIETTLKDLQPEEFELYRREGGVIEYAISISARVGSSLNHSVGNLIQAATRASKSRASAGVARIRLS
jgi:hypothetical protein